MTVEQKLLFDLLDKDLKKWRKKEVKKEVKKEDPLLEYLKSKL